MVKISNLLAHWRRIPELLRAKNQTPAWPELIRRYLGIGSPAYPWEIPLLAGGNLQIDGREELKVFWQIFLRRCYRLPRHCGTIVDVGANVGIFALWAARESPSARIICLEPCSQTFRTLERNIYQNGLYQRITPRQCALAGENGPRLMRTGAESPHRSLILEQTQDSVEDAVPVSCITLPDFLRSEQLESVDVLKMDVEGSEWEVLLSTPPAVLSSIRHILLEYHEVNARLGYTSEQLFAHLAQAGHKVTHHEEDADRTGLAFFQYQESA